MCVCCGAKLENLDIALTKKLINRASKEFFCIDCLAKKFSCEKKVLYEKAEHFKKMGCGLFN